MSANLPALWSQEDQPRRRLGAARADISAYRARAEPQERDADILGVSVGYVVEDGEVYLTSVRIGGVRMSAMESLAPDLYDTLQAALEAAEAEDAAEVEAARRIQSWLDFEEEAA